ncbi:response regulator transcription factor [Deinococcus yavapaiensis]|uniref:LuxR family two component transcriptional regulator n=1 Tax=Deinococcus yavapaiensis KR-236 TaxID=694435 RepID=A0A318S658_9DEIO|nr:response regulator [Deinococcus yavapaiensis]PYE53112.1 LuxR family two component transcriptional regulator [Deinococcus yavapaiensis KR-236]
MLDDAPTVFLVDDDDAVRDALATLLGTVGLSVRDFASPAAFLSAFDASAFGCLILDVRMPHVSGLELQARLSADGVDLPVIVVTGHGDIDLCRRAFKQGAVEFLTKPIDEHDLLDAVQRAVRQHAEVRQRHTTAASARARLARLTDREADVLRLLVDGASNKEAARSLGISARTIETHRASLFEKLGANSVAELVRMYLASREGP